MTASNIEWTQHVWNPLAGCSVHSPGCTNCYAMKMAYRLEAMAKEQMMLRDSPLAHYCGTTTKVNGKAVWTGQVNLSEAALLAPLRRRKPTTWFVNSMSDLFHEAVPDETIDRIFAAMALSPQHTFQLLTKRSARMREYFSDNRLQSRIVTMLLGLENRGAVKPGRSAGALRNWPLPNVWLGVSVEDQARANERIPDLLETPAAIRWISAEPLLGPVDFSGVSDDRMRSWDWLLGENATMHRDGPDFDYGPKLDWVVTGGESGPRHRDNNFEANARSLLDQCRAAGVAFFGKQNVGKRPLPEDLMVREFPA